MSDRTNTSRLEAFCDGVFAIAITLLVRRAPEGPVSLLAPLV